MTEEKQPDIHFDKKMLTLIFFVVLLCLMVTSLYPVKDAIAQNSIVTVLTGALTTILGGIITLTSGRTSQRAVDTQTSVGPDKKEIVEIKSTT